jgi:hypothetical protein
MVLCSAGVAGALAVLPLCRRWWQLGRDVSLNPLEVATAFSAPLLAGADTNADWAQLAKAVGAKRVRYGAFADAASPGGAGADGGTRKLVLRMTAIDAEADAEVADASVGTS